jgi:hypothetical protein
MKRLLLLPHSLSLLFRRKEFPCSPSTIALALMRRTKLSLPSHPLDVLSWQWWSLSGLNGRFGVAIFSLGFESPSMARGYLCHRSVRVHHRKKQLHGGGLFLRVALFPPGSVSFNLSTKRKSLGFFRFFFQAKELFS